MRRISTRSALLAAILVAGATAVAILPSAVSGSSVPPERTPIGAPVPADVLAASAAPGSTWQPEAAIYGVGKHADQPVRMSDGTILRADVYYPTDKTTGQPATGPFPVVLTQTPYGKGALGAVGGTIAAQTGPSSYLIERGYLDVVADVRGTGDSEGSFGLFDPVQDTDGVTLVDWAAGLPNSDGKVGLYGASYLGINQLLTAGHIGPNSPLKAIFPVVPSNDLFKDTADMGGLIDASFDVFYLGLTGGLNAAGPVLSSLENPQNAVKDLNPALAQHLADLATFDATFAANILLGHADAFDDAYWQARNPVNVLQQVVDNGIPAYLVGGEFDLFQRGEPLDYSGLQNAYAGRPVTAAMLADQPVTGRYQLLDGPWTHLAGSSVDLGQLQLEWFDTWLKGENTGMASTPTPLHYYDLGTNTFTEHAQYPFPNTTPTRLYFTNQRSGSAPLALQDGSLSTTAPATAASQTLLWSPVGNPCNPTTDQWSAGLISTATGYLTDQAPCVNTDPLGSLGINKINYTTAPLPAAKTIGGPIDVTVYAKATSRDTEWVAQVQDVAPNGTVTPLTEGALLGSLRAGDPATTWTAADGQILQAGHPYTAASAQPVPVGKTVRYDIEVFPTYATIAAGHRLRITLTTADTPHLVPTLPALANLIGGVYSVELGGSGPSAVEIPFVD